MQIRRSASHWGAFRAVVDDGRLVRVEPFEHDPEPNQLNDVWPEMLTSPLRVARPSVRKGWLDGDGGSGRGEDEFVEVSWPKALDLVAGELRRVRGEFGNQAIFGGSYGWSSAGRLHHARTLVRRFLNTIGGFTDQTTNYSYGAAMVLLPRILGRDDAIGSHLTSAASIHEHCDLLLAFGGIPDRNWHIQAGGAGEHRYRSFMSGLRERVDLVNISPRRDDVPEEFPAQWLPIRPNTDTALILALARYIVASGNHDQAFLDRYCEGGDRFLAYLAGESDGVEKTPAWAADICGIPEESIRALAEKLIGRRVMITATWSLQRAHRGEQPYWAVIALAALLGQIGLPGGGFAFGYGSSNGMGNPRYETPLYGLPVGRNPVGIAIPVARVADLLLRPGETFRFNGREVTYPEIRLVYWAGGNPFHHHQDLNRLREAFRKPETVIVNECFWTSTARHADIVLPATTALERDDIGGASRDPYILAMQKVVEPVGEARNDFDIFADLAERLGVRDEFTDGLDEPGLLRRGWDKISERLRARGIEPPSLETFWEEGSFKVDEPSSEYVMFEDFRNDPVANPLGTPSGRIEIFSKSLFEEGGGAHPGHPAWLAPDEWLGAADTARYPLHLITPQPSHKLHGQMDGSRYVRAHKKQDRELVSMHPDDAARRGIAEGDPVRVFNERGACLAVAALDAGLFPGVAVLPTGSAFDPSGMQDRNSNPNVLTRDIGSSEIGQGCAAQSCLVEIARHEGALPSLDAYHPPVMQPDQTDQS